MKLTILALCLGCGLLPAATPGRTHRAMSDDMRRAIAWEHYKDRAAARQAEIERRHPSVGVRGEASREEEHAVPPQRRVADKTAPVRHEPPK